MQHPARSLDQTPPRSATANGGHDAHTALVLAAAAGDQAAWSALVQRFAGLVWAIARAHGLSAREAASAAGATWLRLAQGLDRVHEPAHVGVWLAATTRQESLRVLRLRGRHGLGDDDTKGTVGDPSEPDAMLWQAFEGLPAGCRSLLRVAAADPPPSSAEISAALAIPLADIAPTRTRCLDRLRQQPGLTAATRQGDHHA